MAHQGKWESQKTCNLNLAFDPPLYRPLRELLMSSEVDRLKCHLFLPSDISVNENEYDKGPIGHLAKKSKGLPDLYDRQLFFIIEFILAISFTNYPVSWGCILYSSYFWFCDQVSHWVLPSHRFSIYSCWSTKILMAISQLKTTGCSFPFQICSFNFPLRSP